VVAGDAVATLGCHRDTAEDVAAADHDADLDAELPRLGDVGGDLVGDRDVDAEPLRAHQRLAGGLQQDAAIQRLCSHAGSS
jgi:hypothetical protein